MVSSLHLDDHNESLSMVNEDIGEVWANILHNVYAALVKQRGFFPDARFNPTYVDQIYFHIESLAYLGIITIVSSLATSSS